MWIVLAVAITVVAAGCSNKAAAGTTPSQLPQLRKIVALGDSLTSGHGLPSRDQAYPAVLEKMLRGARLPFTVVNHGMSGDRTADALRRLDAALAERPDILIVALGANDGLRGVPIAQVRDNLSAIIEAAQAREVAVLLCGMEALPVHGFEYSIAFHNLFPALADKYGVPLVPFLLTGVVGNQEMLQPDFVHPNAAGAAQIARTIWPYLQPLAMRLASIETV